VSLTKSVLLKWNKCLAESRNWRTKWQQAQHSTPSRSTPSRRVGCSLFVSYVWILVVCILEKRVLEAFSSRLVISKMNQETVFLESYDDVEEEEVAEDVQVLSSSDERVEEVPAPTETLETLQAGKRRPLFLPLLGCPCSCCNPMDQSDEHLSFENPLPSFPGEIAAAQASGAASEEEANACTICLEPWNSTGDHRICYFKCGHLFGRRCIVLWLRASPRCPQCNSRRGPASTHHAPSAT
jgi:Ring finger domain